MQYRVVRTAAATLTHTFVDGETAVDAGSVTVAVTDANGDTVATGAASAGTDTGTYTYVLAGQALLQQLTVAWTGTIASTVVTETDQAEIVGGRFFTLPEGRAANPTIKDVVTYPTARLIAARLATEQECEEICDRGFVPHYGREVLDGTGSGDLALSGNDIRSIRAVRMAVTPGGPFTALTSTELAALVVTADRTLSRLDRNVWADGRDNVIVEYEYGLSAPPADLVRATMKRFRWWVREGADIVPDRAVSYTAADGTSYRLDMPSAFSTGMPAVDGIYARYSLRSNVGANGSGETGRQLPASRSLNFDPQRGALFHGGIR